MVNASLNWASIVGIVLAVCGAGLYFMRSFKPALARDYDVFFAAIGLLCGGILFFQGWRLDPILQFGQFLLAGTTVFFAYESVRLRGVATDQARRSTYFDEDAPTSRMPSGGGSRGWDDSYDQFDESIPVRRRFVGQRNLDDETNADEDFYRPRRTSRAAIPEEAASRRPRRRLDDSSWQQNSDVDPNSRRMARFTRDDSQSEKESAFGKRRNVRQEQRRGSRPLSSQQTSRSRQGTSSQSKSSPSSTSSGAYSASGRSVVPQGTPIRSEVEDAAFSPSPRSPKRGPSNETGSRSSYNDQSPRPAEESSDPRTRNSRPRDNSSRFDN